jgi:ABC-2 type transport system permease protein
VTVVRVIRSEWIKFRSVRSTWTGIGITVLLTIGLGALITSAIRSHWSTMDPLHKLTFDPVSTSLAGVFFAQFAVGVIGANFITAEYSSGAIRTTLSAVPNRFRLIGSKLVVLTVSVLIVSEIASFAAFILGQSIYHGVAPTASLSNPTVVRAVVMTGVYLTMMAILGFSLGLLLRNNAATITTFASMVLILPLIVFMLPTSWQHAITRYEPSQLGAAMRSTINKVDQFTPWVGFTILILYVVVFLVGSLVVFLERDA